jgi:hypothetical protein
MDRERIFHIGVLKILRQSARYESPGHQLRKPAIRFIRVIRGLKTGQKKAKEKTSQMPERTL